MVRRIVAALTVLVLASGCDMIRKRVQETTDAPAGNGNLVTTADKRVDDVPTGEPGADRHRWRPATLAGRDLAGNLTASLAGGRGGPLMLAFSDGVTVELERMADQRGEDRMGASQPTFTSAMSVDPNAGVYVYKVQNERIASSAKSGLCGGATAKYVAISEFVDRSGDWKLSLAAFKGAAPGPQITEDPRMCVALSYELQ
jgi:uncharacterized protein YceK